MKKEEFIAALSEIVSAEFPEQQDNVILAGPSLFDELSSGKTPIKRKASQGENEFGIGPVLEYVKIAIALYGMGKKIWDAWIQHKKTPELKRVQAELLGELVGAGLPAEVATRIVSQHAERILKALA